MASLYDTDILAWSEDQARRLRQHADSERRNDALIDWDNIIEEIEDVGSERLHSVEGLLRRALQHMLKAVAWPVARDAAHWQAEARLFRDQAADCFTPSMRQKLDLPRLYAQALRAVPDNYDGQAPLPLPSTCPVTLDELLSDAP